MPANDLKIALLSSSETDLTRVKACFDENGSPKELKHLRWQYARDNHPTDILCALGSHDNLERVAGIYAVFRSRFHVGNVLVDGCQSLDTITDIHFRRRGLFKQLATQLYEHLANDDVNFVYGFPNGSSNPGFTKHLGWKNLDPVPYLVRPLSTSYLARAAKLSGHLPNFKLPTLPNTLTRTRIEQYRNRQRCQPAH